MIVKCNKIFWDGGKCIKYHPGDQDDIDPLSPAAMYFDFPEGTEVYCKIKGKAHNKNGKGGTPNIETTRIVGQPFPTEARIVDEGPDLFGCEICNAFEGTKKQMTMHQVHCRKKHVTEVKE